MERCITCEFKKKGPSAIYPHCDYWWLFISELNIFSNTLNHKKCLVSITMSAAIAYNTFLVGKFGKTKLGEGNSTFTSL